MLAVRSTKSRSFSVVNQIIEAGLGPTGFVCLAWWQPMTRHSRPPSAMMLSLPDVSQAALSSSSLETDYARQGLLIHMMPAHLAHGGA
jgi:hypothetical protein